MYACIPPLSLNVISSVRRFPGSPFLHLGKYQIPLPSSLPMTSVLILFIIVFLVV